MSQARKTRVAAAVKAIKDFHALGRKIPPKRPPREAYSRGHLAEAAGRLGVSVEYARQARQLADPEAGYTRAELDGLCAAIREVQPSQDDALPVFGPTHLIRLLTVPRGERAGLQRAAVAGGWSSNRLEYEIGVRFGTRRHGGRKRRLPEDVVGLLAQVERLCESWRRWLQAVTPPAGEEGARKKPSAPSLADFPPRVRRLVREADAALANVHRAATDELTARRPERAVRHQFREADGG